MQKVKILVVDDLAEKRLAYHAILEELGEEVLAVASGGEALRQVLLHDFAVILLDVNMPDIDGFETARLIRQRKRSGATPVIFLTAFTDEVKAAEGYATGAVDYLATPVVPEILRAKVRVFVELHRMRGRMAKQAEQEALRAAADESARRAALLSEASRALANSLDRDAVLKEVAGMCVPALADYGVATLADGRTSWAVGGTAGPVEMNGQNPWLKEAFGEVMHGDRPEILHFAAVPFPGLLREDCPPATAFLVLPLRARGRTLGAFALAATGRERRWSDSELAMIRELAARAGIGLDNAMLVNDIQEKDRLKNEFLAMLAHELRNPLAPIRNALHMLDLAPTDPAKLERVRDIIGRQVSHLVRLVDDLLDISRITERKIRLEMKPLDLAEAIAAAVETSRPLIESQGHQLTVAVPEPPVCLLADATRLAQVLSNLLNNAAKYTPPGGRIELSVERSADLVLLRVKDNGIGIPQDMLGRVFELFTQVDRSLDRSQGGLGIGLTLVRELVVMHGGEIEVRSEGPNRGSEFTVRLPAGSDATVAAGEPAVLSTVTSTRRRILVVDDNRDAADTLAILLDLDGHEVRTTYTGTEGLEVSNSYLPDAVLLDIGLPGLDGYEVARRIRRANPAREILLVAVSGYGTEQDRQVSREAGFDHHLVKPVEYQRLRELLTDHPRAGSR